MLPEAFRDIMKNSAILSLVVSFILLCGGCVCAPPHQVNNVCYIFKQYPKWYWAAQDTQKRWGVPIAVQMAIIHQESRFQANAKPPRRHLLGFIPWTRPSSAYGYTQALDATWNEYRNKSGNHRASRKNFHDALDFIGWYASRASKKLHVSTSNAYIIYLAYHEGVGGVMRKTYKRKVWLMHVAKKVSARSRLYQSQLVRCQKSLPRRHFWNIWY